MSGSSNTQVQKTEPSDYSKSYTAPGLDEAKKLFAEGPAKYYESSTVAGFSPETSNALSAMTARGMGGAAGRAGSQYALDRFAGGDLGDWGTVDNLRTLGLSNGYANDPAASRLGDMSFNGSGLGAAASGRIGDIARNGGGVAEFTGGRVGDLSTTGGNNLAQFRNDVGDIISGQAQNANPALAQLGLTSSGARLSSDPYLDATFNKAADAVTRSYRTGVSPTVDGTFALSSGAATSGAAENARDQAEENYGKTLSGLSADIYGGAYDKERARQEAATAALGGNYLSGLGLRAQTAGTSAGQGTADAQTRLAATGAISGDMSGDIARRLSASGQLTGAEGQDAANKLAANAQLSSTYNAGADRQLASTAAANSAYNASRAQQLQGLGLQPQYQAMDYTDLGKALGAGQANDTMAQNVLNADIDRWDYNQNAPWANVQRYLALVNGGQPGTSNSVTQSGGNPLSSILSGAGGAGQLALALKGLGLF